MLGCTVRNGTSKSLLLYETGFIFFDDSPLQGLTSNGLGLVIRTVSACDGERVRSKCFVPLSNSTGRILPHSHFPVVSLYVGIEV